ncbi:hypothetical protein BsWGS_17838 [Bradybaena similaris]
MSVILTLTEPQFMKEELNEDSRPSGGQGRVNGEEDETDAREAELIEFENTAQGLGLKICGGCSTDGTENFGIFVKRVLPGGLAATSGDIFSGDLILEVNGQSVQGVSYDRAVAMLRQASASNYVQLVVARDADAQKEYSEYMNRFGTLQSPLSPLTARDFINGSQLEDSDAEFQRKMENTLKDSELDAYKPGEHHSQLHQGKYGEINGHISPTSSCASEVANHMDDLAGSSHAKKFLNNGFSGNKNTPAEYLDALLSKRLSQDHGSKLHVDQLESAIVNLGLQLSPTTQMTLRESLNIDQNGLVKFEDFVEAAKSIFQNELAALRRSLSPKAIHENVQHSGNTSDEYTSVISERDQLRAEVAALKEELRNCNQSSKNVEEQLLFVRKHAQASIEEVRSLKSKLHLSEQAQTKAQQTERDYEEVVAMLENEVSQLRLQLSKSDGVHMHKRLAVLVCQLKKAESGKKTYEVATEKLIRYIEHSQEVLASLENSSRTTGTDGASSKVNKKRALHQLSTEGADVIKTVRSLMETISLPFGWEEAYTTDGVKYYINHLNQTTTWTHPVSCMEHHTSAKTAQLPAQEQQQQPHQQTQPSPSQQTKLKHPPPPQRSAHSKQQQDPQSKESKQQKDFLPPEKSKKPQAAV